MPQSDRNVFLAYQSEYHAKRYAQRRASWFAENGPCQHCGSTEDLEADHIDWRTKKIRPGMLWALGDDNPRRIAELKKLQVLCAPCHKKKSRKDRLERRMERPNG